jgi:hypothetical protein
MVTIDGDRYLKVRHVILLPEVGDMKTYASNLFTGSEQLSEYSAVRFRYSSDRYRPRFTAVTDTGRGAVQCRVNGILDERTASVFRDLSFIP